MNTSGKTTTVDIIAVDKRTNATIIASLITPPISNDIVLRGLHVPRNGGQAQNIYLSGKRSDFTHVQLSDPTLESEKIHILDLEGKKTGHKFIIEKHVSKDGVFDSYTGEYFAPDGCSVNFSVYTDPDPVVVIVAIMAAACVSSLIVDALTRNCIKELSPAIEACQESGGLPTVVADIFLGLSLDPLRFGCGVNCRLECVRGDAANQLLQMVTAKQASGSNCQTQARLEYIHIANHTQVGDSWDFDIKVSINGDTEQDISQKNRTVESDGNVPIVSKIVRKISAGCGEQKVTVKVTGTEKENIEPNDVGGTTETKSIKCTQKGEEEAFIVTFDVFETGFLGVDTSQRATVEVGFLISTLCGSNDETSSSVSISGR